MSAAEQPERSWEELEQDAEREYGESWLPWKNPDQPQTLVARVEDYNLGPDFGYGRSWICDATDRNGKAWSIWIGVPPASETDKCSVLFREFDEKRPKPGERITIRYQGFQDKPRGGGPGYHRFGLTVDRGQQLPEFLTRPRLEAGQDPGDVPIDTGGLPPAADVDVPDADVIEDGGDDELPF